MLADEKAQQYLKISRLILGEYHKHTAYSPLQYLAAAFFYIVGLTADRKALAGGLIRRPKALQNYQLVRQLQQKASPIQQSCRVLLRLFCCQTYRNLLNQYSLQGGMSRKGDCWDTQLKMILSLKMERVWRRDYANHQETSRDVTDYIVGFYSSRRQDYLSPNDVIFLHRIVERDGDTGSIFYDLDR